MKSSPTQPIAYGCLALSMALVGCYVAFSKPLVAALPVFVLAWLRFGLGSLAMLHWLKRPADEPPITPQTRRLLFLESLLGNFLFSICMLYGVSMTSAVSAGVIMASIPAVVALLSWAFLRERLDFKIWLAIACAGLGVALLSLSKQELQPEHLRGLEADLVQKRAQMGNLLIVGAVFCEAAYAVIGKKLTGVMGAKRIASVINLWGFVLMTPLGLYGALGFNFGALTGSTWALLGFYSMAASVGSVWLWMTGLKTVSAARAGVFTVMLPISAALTGVLFLGEHLGQFEWMAFAVALLGVLLATYPAKRPLQPHVDKAADRSLR